MSEIKALEKLRKYTLCDKGERYTAYINADELADEIQAEVDARFTARPCDANGAPIRVGEHVRGKYTDDKTLYKVHGFMFDFEHGQWNIALNESRFASSNLLICVKPRTLEDILNDHLQEREKIVRKLENSLITLGEAESEEKTCDKLFADEIRELMKEGGE